MEEPPAPGAPDLSLFSLFPTVEEQIENIAQAQTEESKGPKETSSPARERSKHPTTKTPEASEGELSAAARALAQKMQPDITEGKDGQLSLDLFGAPAPEPPAPPRPVTPPPKPVVVETILSPELEAERQQRIAAEEKEAAARYDLGYGHMGNGLTVWNRLAEEHGDYKTVAHIAPDRTMTFYDQDMPETVKAQIRKIAMTAEMSISATQDAPVFSVPPQVPEQEQTKQDTVPQSSPTIRELHEKYVSIVKGLVLADTAYQNACVNSDKENAYLEGNEAILRAVHTIEDPVFLRLYFDHATFHNRLHRDVLDSTYPTLSQPQQEHKQDKSGDGLDTVPYNFELEYRVLSRLKSDCEYFLGAGGRAQKHLSEGGIEAQIAKMRELYDTVPEKPEWLTAEDIDRYEAQMQAGAVETTVPNYKVTVTAEEAPLLSRLLANRGIDTAQSVHSSGEVTFSFAASVRDVVEKLLAQLRAELSRAVSATYAAPKKPGRSRPELNYRKFAKMFPEFSSGEYRSLHMESGPSMMPLHLQWIDTDVIAVSHTYQQNGDLMYDPEMTFRIDREKGTLESLSFRQDGFPRRNDEVYPEPGKWRPKLRSSLNRFAQQWFKNISQQNYHKREAVAVRNGEDVNLTFDPDGKALEPAPTVQPEPAAPEVQPYSARDPLAPAYQVGDTVYVDNRRYVIASIGQTHVQIEDTAQRYPTPRPERIGDFEQHLIRDSRNSEITRFLSAYLPEVNDDLREALTGDGGLLELRDKAVIAGYIQAGEDNLKIAQRLADTYAGTAETMTLLTGDQADYFADKSGFEVHILDKFNTKVSMTWNLIAPILRALYQQELDGFLHEVPAADHAEQEQAKAGTETPPALEAVPETAKAGAPEQRENGGNALDPKLLAPAYQVGDTVYLEDRAFEISGITPSEVQVFDKAIAPPIMTSVSIMRFEWLLRQDPRNLPASDFLSTDTSRVRDDTRKILTDWLLSSDERDIISRWFRSGEGNIQIAGHIAEMLYSRADSVEIPGNPAVVSYFTDSEGVHVTSPLNASFETWEQVAAILRSLWQQELDGFSHEPPAVDTMEQANTASPVILYKHALDLLDKVIKKSDIYSYLYDHRTDYDEATTELLSDLSYYMEKAAGEYPDIMEAYRTLPKFREWLVADILERNYEWADVNIIPKCAPERYVDEPDAPEWVRQASAVDLSRLNQAGAGTEIPPEPETVPEPTDTGTSEQAENTDTTPAEPNLTPNVDEYLNLKVQHPDKLIGVQVGEYMLFYGKDAEEAAPALGTKLPVRDIPGLGTTPVTGSNLAWQATLKDLLEHGKSVVLARPDPERGPDAPYEIIKERDAAEYIPIGMELTVDGHRMRIDSVDYTRGEVTLLDMEIKGYMPTFTVQPVPYVRQFVEEQQDRDFEADIQREMESLTSGSLEEQDHAEADDLETAKQLINDFCTDVYQAEEVDFSNPEHIGIAYTTTEDEKHKIQVEVNLLDFSVSQLVDDVCVEKRSYDSLRELIDSELTDLDFDELVRLKHDIPTEPERVELDGGKVAPSSTPVTSKVVRRYDAGAFEIVVEEMHFGPEKHNFHITDDNLGAGGDKTKYQYNVAAIRTLKQIEADGRLATPEEQEILSRYVGWGGLAPAFDPDNEKWAKEYAELYDLLTPEEYASARATTVNAHYTSPTVVKAMYQAVENMNFQPGTVLEPSMGIGNFFGLLPESMAAAKLHGVELDDLTGRIAKQLYQKADIAIDGFENTDHPDNYFDLAVATSLSGSTSSMTAVMTVRTFSFTITSSLRRWTRCVPAVSWPLSPPRAPWTRKTVKSGQLWRRRPTCWGLFACRTMRLRPMRAPKSPLIFSFSRSVTAPRKSCRSGWRAA